MKRVSVEIWISFCWFSFDGFFFFLSFILIFHDLCSISLYGPVELRENFLLIKLYNSSLEFHHFSLQCQLSLFSRTLGRHLVCSPSILLMILIAFLSLTLSCFSMSLCSESEHEKNAKIISSFSVFAIRPRPCLPFCSRTRKFVGAAFVV